MAAKLQTSRKKRSVDDDADMETIQAPPAPQMQGSEQLQMPQPPQRSADLSRHEIRDRVAMGGMSSLELQSLIRSNHFLTDEDIAAYTGKGGGHEMSAPTSIAPPPENMFTPSGGPAPHSAPIGGHDSLGFDGALAPQGLMAPQGFMTKVGMLGFVKGLMGIRSDGARPSAPPKQQQSASTQMPKPTAPRQQAASQQQSASAKSPTQQQAAQQQAAQQPAAKQNSQPQAPAASQGSSAFQPVASAFDSSQAFQPVQAEGNNWIRNAMWGQSQSPFVEIVKRFFAMLKSIFGSQNQVPPHMRGGKH